MKKYLYLLLIVPILLFSNIDTLNSSTQNKTQLSALLSLVSNVGDTVHYLQQERGASCGFVSSDDKKFKSKLGQISNNSDEKIKKLLTDFNTNKVLLNKYFTDKEYTNLNTKFNELYFLRDDVNNKNINFAKVYSKYTQIIASLLLNISDIAEKPKDEELRDRLYAYSTLLMHKESIGQKRAALSALFSQKTFSKEIYEYFLTSDTQEKIYLKTFLHSVDKSIQELYIKTLDNNVVTTVQNYEKLALDKLSGKEVNTDPIKWFESVTKKIDLVQSIEYKIFEDISNLTKELSNSFFNSLTNEEKSWIDSHKTINVASETDYAPWDFTIDSKPAGYSIDYIKLLAKKTGLKLNFITDRWENLVNKVQTGEIDLIHTMYKNKTHTELTFIAPYKKVIIGLYANGNSSDINSINDLSKKTVSIPSGDSTSQGLDKTIAGINFKFTDGYIESLKDVAFSKADAAVMDMAVANYLIEQNTLTNIKIVGEAEIDDKLIQNQYYLAVNKNLPILASILKKAMDSVTDEEEKYISNRWILGFKTKDNSKAIDLNLNKEEKEWLKSHPVVKFTGDPSWLPFEAFNKDGKYIGIVSEYLDKLESLTKVKFEKVPVSSWNESLELSKNKKVDVLSETTESSREGLIFTKPYITNDIIIVMDKEHNYVDGLEAIKHKKIALIKDYGYIKQIEDKFPYIDFIEVDNIEDALTEVSTGKIDALVCTFALGTYTTTKMGLSNIKVVGKTQFKTSLGLGIREDYAPLVSILNKAIDHISEKEHNEIFNHWIKQEYVEKVDYTLLYKVGGGAFILLLMFVFWNRKMAKEISKRKEIEQKLQDSSARMSTLFDASPDSISILDADGNYVDCNEATLKIFGLVSKEDFLQLKPADLSPELQYNNQPSSEVASKVIAIAFEKGISQFEWQHKRINTGELFDTEVILSLVSLDNKPYVYGVVRDITKIKKAQKEITEIQNKQRLIIEDKVKELTLKQTKQLETIERSNNLLSGRENKMVELKSEINEYALKLGIEQPYVIVNEAEENLIIQNKETTKEIDITTLLDIPKLQLLMEDFYRFMNIPLAIIDLEGNILVQSKWSRACTDFHRANSESCKRCIESDVDISHKLEEGKDFSVYKCKNGLIDCASPLIVNGQHFANFFIGQFLTQEPDMEFFTKQAKFFGYDVDDYTSAIKDAVVISEDRLPHILGFLKEITEIISNLSNEKLNFQRQEKNMSQANIASMNLAEDAQKATKEIEIYKNHLEDLVNERTDELNNQKQFVQTLLDSQEQLIVTTNGKTMTSANKTFSDFYNVENVEKFKINYDADCICETFNTSAPKDYLQIKMGDESWIDYVITRSDSSYTHKAMISRNDVNYIFSVSAAILPGEDGLKSAVFTNITEMENAKQEVETIHKHTRESIEYASLIQSALIPDNNLFKNYFSDHLAIWYPKDIVGGDIYLFEELRDKDECLLMVIDCTGHGVPGAFVTMLVKAIERQIIAKINNDLTIDVSPAWILSYFNRKMKILLKQEDADSISNAGFDGGIIYFNKKEKILKFSGAETPLFYMEDDELKTIKGSRHSIGYKKSDPNFEFKEHTVKVKKGMQFYCTTDGFLDQNGGNKGFPYSKKRFANLIKEWHEETFENQEQIYLNALSHYQGNEERNDDVTLVGFKI